MLSFLSFSNRYYSIFLTHNWDHLAVSGGFSIGVTTNNRVADRFTICIWPAFGKISEPHSTEYGHIQSVTTALYMSAYDLSVNLFF